MKSTASALLLVCISSVHIIAWQEQSKKRDSTSQVGSDKCPYPCTCPTDGYCEGCEECPRQLGEPCNEEQVCDRQQGLLCSFKHGDREGVCRESLGMPCVVYNRTYKHGETFSLDCRTQCTCQNGTYGCSSLCPQERILPKGSCQHPRLVEIPGQCCREWMCDSPTVEQPPVCRPTISGWSDCSSTCGVGISIRRSNLNVQCKPKTEARLCQFRRCDDVPSTYYQPKRHLRRGHECKATHRLGTAVNLQFGPCRTRKLFRPKYCGLCTVSDIKCEPVLSTTVNLEFFCNGLQDSEHVPDLLQEYIETGTDMWELKKSVEWDSYSRQLTIPVQWILKCRCDSISSIPTSSSGEIILHRVHRTSAP